MAHSRILKAESGLSLTIKLVAGVRGSTSEALIEKTVHFDEAELDHPRRCAKKIKKHIEQMKSTAGIT